MSSVPREVHGTWTVFEGHRLKEIKTVGYPWLVWLSGLSAGREPKGHQFDSQSGHMPGLQARSPVGGAQEATTH